MKNKPPPKTPLTPPSRKIIGTQISYLPLPTRLCLAGLGLVDELLLIIMPKALGRGQSLFNQLRQPMKLTLLNTREFRSGAVLHHYQDKSSRGRKRLTRLPPLPTRWPYS